MYKSFVVTRVTELQAGFEIYMGYGAPSVTVTSVEPSEDKTLVTTHSWFDSEVTWTRPYANNLYVWARDMRQIINLKGGQ